MSGGQVRVCPAPTLSTSRRSACYAPPGCRASQSQCRGSKVTSRATTPNLGRPRTSQALIVRASPMWRPAWAIRCLGALRQARNDFRGRASQVEIHHAPPVASSPRFRAGRDQVRSHARGNRASIAADQLFFRPAPNRRHRAVSAHERLFRLYADGIVFVPANDRQIKAVGIGLIAYSAAPFLANARSCSRV